MTRVGWFALICAGALSYGCDRPSFTISDSVPITGGSTSFGGSTIVTPRGGAGSAAAGAAGDACRLDRLAGEKAIFADQAVGHASIGRTELYLEVTDSEAEGLRQGGSLIPAAPGIGPTPALTQLLNSLLGTVSDLRRPLVQMLLDRFRVTRATWPNSWALRLISHPGSEHMNPVRLVLRDDAWMVRITDASPVVVDLANNPVGLSDAMAHPERIAAIFYLVNAGSELATGSSSCDTGKREYALATEAMVETVELQTQAILDRLDGDIDALDRFFKVARVCGQVDSTSGLTFHAATVCQAWGHFDLSSELSAYQWSLSDPVELYKPSAQSLSTLVQALEDDRFTPDPFVSAPHPLPVGDAGAAADGGSNAGGAGGGGAANGGVSGGGFSQGGR